METHQLVSLIEKCSSYIKELKLTANPKLWLDVAILDMSNLTENTKLEDLHRRLSALESGDGVKFVNPSPYNTPPSPVKKPEIMKPIKAEIKQDVPVVVSQSVAAPTEEEVLSESVPMSKSAPPNALKATWVKLLESVSSFPSRAILKQQAVPVKLSADEVIITIKNPSWLKQFAQDGSKHSCIVDAANIVFGSVKKVIVRAPESGDDAIRKEFAGSDDDDKPAPATSKTFKPKTQEINKEDVVEAIQIRDEVEYETSDGNNTVEDVSAQQSVKKYGKADAAYHTDDVNMVMDLFEGKFIE